MVILGVAGIWLTASLVGGLALGQIMGVRDHQGRLE